MNRYLAVIFLILTSCSCRLEDIPEIAAERNSDLKLSCRGIEFEVANLLITEESLKRKELDIAVYAGYPHCLPKAQIQLKRSIENINTRIERLAYLYDFKNCDKQDNTKLSEDTEKYESGLEKTSLAN